MNRFDELIEQATARLGADRALRLEIARELRTHLDESAQEFRAAGYHDPEAEAAKRFGDPTELAEQLWRANRLRMRLRAVAWWTARVTLLPAAIIACGLFMVSNMTVPWMAQALQGGIGSSGDPLTNWAEDRAEQAVREQMSPTQELIFFGDESAASPVERWRGLRDRFPDEPLYQTNYITWLLVEHGGSLNERDPEALGLLLDALDRGERIEPDNGFYAAMRAALLLSYAGELTTDESLAVTTMNRQGEPDTSHPMVYAEVDDAMLRRGLAALREAAGKPYVTDHAVDMLRHRIEQLPPAQSMRDYVYRIGHAVGTLLPTLNWERTLARAVQATAIRMSRHGDAASASAVLDDLRQINAKRAAGNDTFIGLLVTASIRDIELGTRVLVADLADQPEQAASAQRRLDEWTRRFHGWRHAGEADTEALIFRAGILLSMMIPNIPGYDVDVTPFRLAEYNLFDRGALTVLLLALILLAAIVAGAGLQLVWRRRDRKDAPILLWIGWRRFGLVTLGAVVLPVLAFTVFAFSPLGGREWGVNHNPVTGVDHLAAGLLVLMLLWLLGVEALRRRAAELGISTPAQRRPMTQALELIAVLLVVTAIGAGIMYTLRHSSEHTMGLAVGITTGAVLGPVVVWLWVARQVTWLRSLERPERTLWQPLLIVVVATVSVASVVTTMIWFVIAHPADRAPLSLIGALVCLVAGLLAGLIVTVRAPGRTPLFAGSAVRSMAPLFAAAAVLLAVAVGPALAWRDRVLADAMVRQSPIWIDLEVEKSDARILRAMLADGAAAPPTLSPSLPRTVSSAK